MRLGFVEVDVSHETQLPAAISLRTIPARIATARRICMNRWTRGPATALHWWRELLAASEVQEIDPSRIQPVRRRPNKPTSTLCTRPPTTPALHDRRPHRHFTRRSTLQSSAKPGLRRSARRPRSDRSTSPRSVPPLDGRLFEHHKGEPFDGMELRVLQRHAAGEAALYQPRHFRQWPGCELPEPGQLGGEPVVDPGL